MEVIVSGPFDLERFVTAQAPVFATVLRELEAGRKRTHWMWFIFPQLRALGRSPTAQFYGIGSIEEARAYLAHPVLGARLIACTEAMLSLAEPSLHAILGSPDDLKFHSCMTLFALANGGDQTVFHRALARFCDGRMDEPTVALLSAT